MPVNFQPRPVTHRQRRATRVVPALLLALAALSVSACGSLGYYAQAVGGHWEIWRRQQPIAELLQDPALAPALRARLEYVSAARDFATQHLGLPDNGSYREYADLGRDYVVWNVFAAPELDLTPHESCFVLVGCLAYRGFFARDDAAAYAAALRDQGLEVYLAGVAAYSTLGWFDDPVLNTILGWEEPRIAEILFHELAHQQLYVKDDTTFNESFAEAVAAAGLAHWLTARGNAAAVARWQLTQERENALIALILARRNELAEIYAGPLPRADKLTAKAGVLDTLTTDYATLRARWDDSRFDQFMQEPWNNARLSSIATYRELVPGFSALLTAVAHDFARFYALVAEIAALEPAARHACVAGLADDSAACPGPIRAAIGPGRE